MAEMTPAAAWPACRDAALAGPTPTASAAGTSPPATNVSAPVFRIRLPALVIRTAVIGTPPDPAAPPWLPPHNRACILTTPQVHGRITSESAELENDTPNSLEGLVTGDAGRSARGRGRRLPGPWLPS